MHEWLFFKQHSHEPHLAVARNIIAWRKEAHLYPERLADCAVRGAKALDVMERALSTSAWLAGAGPTIADAESVLATAWGSEAQPRGRSWTRRHPAGHSHRVHRIT